MGVHRAPGRLAQRLQPVRWRGPSTSLTRRRYAHFGQPSIWPRGHPLQNIADPPCQRYRRTLVNNVIQQGLANGDPDVDAIFRITRKDQAEDIRVKFSDTSPAVAYPFGTFSPFNSQNTLFLHDALALLYIPMTTSFRVCDIWRGYWAQRLAWEARSSSARVL